MIDVKQATESASAFFNKLYRDQIASGNVLLGDQIVNSMRLEEVELVEDEKFWLITLSFELPPPTFALGPLSLRGERQYKTFKVDAQTGQVLSMKIRELEYGVS
jgi:hypothetical protein